MKSPQPSPVAVGTCALWLCLAQFADAESAPAQQAVMPKKHGAMFEKYCLDCHDSTTAKGEVNLEDLSFEVTKDIQTAERWQKILNAINSGDMPPKKKKQISDAEKTVFLEDLSTQMVAARAILSDSGGLITLRRLNRREYQYTLEDLLGIWTDVSAMPDDQATTGFDTTGASLFFSSDQLEQYLATARGALDRALLPRPVPKSSTQRIEPEEEYTPHYQEELADLNARRKNAEDFAAQSEKPASAFGFLDPYAAKKQLAATAEYIPQIEKYLARPETKTGATLILTIKGGGLTKVKLPTIREGAIGRYTVRLRAAHYADAPERFHYVEFSEGFGSGRKFLGWRKVTGTLEQPEVIEFPVEYRGGDNMQIWIHQRTHQDRADKNIWQINQKENGIGTPPGVWIDWAELEGPKPDPRPAIAAKAILFDRPAGWDDERYAREVIQRFATRAFRTEVPTPELLERLFQQYVTQRAKGQDMTHALIAPLSIILSSPGFLYMVESTGDKKSPLLTNGELAVRLSYFLWSSPPDEELLGIARNGKLSDPVVLKQQTTRMLADARADRFVRGFVRQWLNLERLDMFQFDGVKFRTFDNAVRENARDEIFQTVHTLLREQLPLQSLLKADFVVINDVLAGYYGLPDVKGPEFRKVAVPEKSLRGGLIGTAAVLAMGSDGVRSSPVERGAWVLRKLLHNPPPPAPPNVPMLSRLDGTPLAARALQKAHQEEPQCAQCHQKIDPIGFGMENFNAAGLWREVETVSLPGTKKKKNAVAEFPVDPSGHLPGGKDFADYFGLRDRVAEHGDEFARGFAEALIAYSLGRPFGFTDKNLADDMLKQAKAGGFDPNVFIHALVQSRVFNTK